MATRTASADCCETEGTACSGFNLESVISLDDRGQMVLPKDLRERAGLGPGDKLALISWEQDGAVCCMCLIKTDALAGMVKNVLGPMMGELAT